MTFDPSQPRQQGGTPVGGQWATSARDEQDPGRMMAEAIWTETQEAAAEQQAELDWQAARAVLMDPETGACPPQRVTGVEYEVSPPDDEWPHEYEIPYDVDVANASFDRLPSAYAESYLEAARAKIAERARAGEPLVGPSEIPLNKQAIAESVFEHERNGGQVRVTDSGFVLWGWETQDGHFIEGRMSPGKWSAFNPATGEKQLWQDDIKVASLSPTKAFIGGETEQVADLENLSVDFFKNTGWDYSWHREGGLPARINDDSTKWMVNDSLHRENGPATVNWDGVVGYYKNDQPYIPSAKEMQRDGVTIAPDGNYVYADWYALDDDAKSRRYDMFRTLFVQEAYDEISAKLR